LLRLIKRAKDEGMYVALSTNGIILNERYVELLKSSGLHAIQVSLDSSDPAENDALRGSFHMALRGASSAASASITTSISCTVTEINPRALGIVELAMNVGVKEVSFIALQQLGRARGRLSLSHKRASDFLRALSRLLSSYPHAIMNGFRFYLDEESFRLAARETASLPGFFTCPAGRTHMAIDWKGDVYGCDLLISPRYKGRSVLINSLKNGGKRLLAVQEMASESVRKMSIFPNLPRRLPRESSLCRYEHRPPVHVSPAQ